MSRKTLFKSAICGLLTTCAATSYAGQFDINQSITLSTVDQCQQELCLPISSYRYQASLPLSFDTQDTYNIDAENQPKYLIVPQDKDWEYLKGQTYTILGLSVATVGLMTLLPESITKWDDDARDLSNLGAKWKDNVSSGPVWDEDEHFLNYVMHPYFGGVYYTAARHAGYDEFESFLYSATMSTFFWEYGVEAFAEVPSWQDLFVTPFFGAVVGEVMLETEQSIVDNGGEVLGSETIGDVSLFFLNPVGHIHHWVSDSWGGRADLQFSSNPWYGNQTAAKFALDAGAPYAQSFYGVNLKVYF